MPSITQGFLFLFVFTVFTMILGAGLLFFQSTSAANVIASPDPALAPYKGAAAFFITFLFLAAAIIFLVGAAKWAGERNT